MRTVKKLSLFLNIIFTLIGEKKKKKFSALVVLLCGEQMLGLLVINTHLSTDQVSLFLSCSYSFLIIS